VLSVEKVELRKTDPNEWDAFARACDGSFRSAHAHLRSLPYRKRPTARVTTYRILMREAASATPIGFYTMVPELGGLAFYDGLKLLPEYRDRWTQALRAALDEHGAGRYIYGWAWSLEPSREAELRLLPEARVESVRDLLVQGVDFSQWPTWDAYYRSISENVRRNCKRARQVHPDLELVTLRGFAALRGIRRLVQMRREMYESKGVQFNRARSVAGYLGRFAVCPEQAMITFAYANSGPDAETLAVQHTVEFGSQMYYLDGASARDPGGAAWLLQLDLLESLHRMWPDGKMLLGYTDLPVVDQSAQGLLRSRNSLRASGWETSIVTFDWSGSAR